MSSLSERTSLTKATISFATAGIKPDISITVFDQTFHVYSLFLKVHSAFFRKFLDSPEKKGNTSTNPAFQYEWVTKVDDDGTWSLVCAPSFPGLSSTNLIEQFTGIIDDEIEAFTNILQAMHSVPFTIKSAAHLCLATYLADYYCALPVLSHGISGALLTSPNFVKEIPEQCIELLLVAFKLRIAVLYKDCMIFLMGPWSAPKFNLLEDKKLKQYSTQAHQKLMCKVFKVEKIFKIALAGQLFPYNDDPPLWGIDFNKQYAKAINVAYTFDAQNNGVLEMPLLLKTLHSSRAGGPIDTVKPFIAPLLENCLSLPTTPISVGMKPYEDHFFCLELNDDDLPWDITEREW